MSGNKKHEKQKFYYTYKITNNITGEYYYGVHETFDLINDWYFGSGSILKENIKKYGIENFTKVILKFFPNRHELLDEEKRIVNKETLNDPKCLNVILGGGELKGSVGKKCIVDEYGIFRMVDKNNNDYQSAYSGRICINKDGKMKYIFPHELEYYIDMGWKKGTIYNSPGKGKIWVHNGERQIFIFEKDLQKYINEGWSKGTMGVGKVVWVNKNEISKQINKEDLQKYLDDGWKRGSGKNTVNGRIVISKGYKRKFVYKEDLQKYLDDGWKYGMWKDVWVNKDHKNTRVPKEDLQKYLDDGWKRGKYFETPPKSRKVYFYDLEGNLVKEFIRVIDANKEGFFNINKYADKNRIYMKQYILKYGK